MKHSKKHFLPNFFIIATIVFVSFSCNPIQKIQFRKQYNEANEVMYEKAQQEDKLYLKAHMKNGDVFILDSDFKIDTIENYVFGQGSLYDFNRRKISKNGFEIPIDSVVLFETNRLPDNRDQSYFAAITLLGTANVALTGFCIANPKACFGSCPTFYLDPGKSVHYSDAEVFSNAIVPSLEYTDINSLNTTENPGSNFILTMKNEAFETHCLRSIDLVLVPRAINQRVFHSNKDKFFLSEEIIPVKKATADEGSITHLLQKNDQTERFSTADPDNMKSKERIHLTFDNINEAEQLGLVIGFRQTLMTTYLLYNAIDHMGNNVSDFMARIRDFDNREETIEKILKEQLGGIEIYIWDKGEEKWIYQDMVYETGPIAINHQIVKLNGLSPGDDNIQVRLELNKGLWRLDYIWLTNILREVEPIYVKPHKIAKNNKYSPYLLDRLNDNSKHLISKPGDIFNMDFHLPENELQYELFLSATGYYLIWTREEWLQEKDLLSLYRMRNKPKRYLKQQAAKYKEYEKYMEEAFWNSRVNHQILSGHETPDLQKCTKVDEYKK